jgi:DNA-binding NarL/FixJ family response regulator
MNKSRLSSWDIETSGEGAQALGNQHAHKRIDGQIAGAQVVWALVDPRPLIREALVRMIEGSESSCVIGGITGAPSPSVIGAASAQDLVDQLAGSNLSIDVILLNVGDGSISQERFRHQLDLLRSRMDSVPVVVLSDRLDVNEVSSAVRAGVRGYIPTTWSSTAVIQALMHVQAGNIHVPAEALSHLCAVPRDGEMRANPESRRRNQRFTPRQLEVLHLLRQGKPNKIIAYELNMQESTVKVHVREIMKKLKVSNRTEAAFRAGQLLAEVDDFNARDRAGTGSAGTSGTLAIAGTSGPAG